MPVIRPRKLTHHIGIEASWPIYINWQFLEKIDSCRNTHHQIMLCGCWWSFSLCAFYKKWCLVLGRRQKANEQISYVGIIDQGEMSGHNPHLLVWPWVQFAASATFEGVWSHPIFLKLESHPLFLKLWSHPLFLKLGWRQVFCISIRVRYLDPHWLDQAVRGQFGAMGTRVAVSWPALGHLETADDLDFRPLPMVGLASWGTPVSFIIVRNTC